MEFNTILPLITDVALPIFGGLVVYIMNNLSSRLAKLESESNRLAQDKLDKSDYHRDQGAIQETLRSVQEDIKNLPVTIINLLQATGSLPK